MPRRLFCSSVVACFLWLLVGCAPAPTTKPAAPGKVKLLFFTQENCPPCELLKAQLAHGANANIIGMFDIEDVAPPDARFDTYGVTETPTLIALTWRGAEQFPGGTLGQLRAWLFDVADPVPVDTVFQAAAPEPFAPFAIGKISEGGPTSPDGKVCIVCDLPASERKKNIALQRLGCCVFRSIEYAARWQQVLELYDLPEQMGKAGIAGGGYPEKVDKILKKFGPNVQYIQDTSGDPAILEAILASGRLPCVTYAGHDGVHYPDPIAHMVCLPYFDRGTGWACVMDNNFVAETQFLWMTTNEFLARWKGQGGGWVVALLNAPPPPVPHN